MSDLDAVTTKSELWQQSWRYRMAVTRRWAREDRAHAEAAAAAAASDRAVVTDRHIRLAISDARPGRFVLDAEVEQVREAARAYRRHWQRPDLHPEPTAGQRHLRQIYLDAARIARDEARQDRSSTS